MEIMKVKSITIAALALLLTACSNEEFLENNENGTMGGGNKVPMTFTAGTQQTRTSLQPADDEGQSAVHWTAGDAIAIWDETVTNQFTTEETGTTAKFTGEVTKGSTAYTAFYPYTGDETLQFGDGTITFTLPAEQTAKSGSFAEGLNPSWAQDTDGSHKLKFQNLCGLAKFTVGIDGVTEVVLTANGDDDALAGSLTYTIADGTLKAAEEGASRSVTLKGTFESGQTYYFVVAPGTLAGGITLRYTGGDGKTYVKTTQKEVTFTAGKIADLGNVATDGFSEALNPAFATAIMDNSNVRLTKNPDGTAFLTNEIKHQMFQVSTLKVKGCSLTSLAGIEYFTQLNSLDCSGNSLESLDVSALTRLTYLDCSGNSLKSLDVSKLIDLTELCCYNNGLETLSLPTTSALTYLQCYNNALTALDVSKQTELINLTCYNNQMTALDITQNTVLEELYCGQQKKGETDLKLVLTLSDNQQKYWDVLWNEWTENSGVEINSQSTSASATNISSAGGNKVVW